jgi:hypothetical protein
VAPAPWAVALSAARAAFACKLGPPDGDADGEASARRPYHHAHQDFVDHDEYEPDWL